MLGLITINSQVSIAKHSSNDDKKTQATDQPTTTEEQDPAKEIDVPQLPIGTVVQGQTATNTIEQPCSDGSDKTNDKICGNPAETNQQEQTTSMPQSTPTPQVNPISNTEISENPISTSTIQQNDNLNDNGQSQSNGGSTSSSTSSDNEQSTGEEKNNFPDKNLGAESHFVVMSQDKGVGLYHIVSDETDLDIGIIPQTIRLVNTFESAGEAMSWLGDYDDRSN